MLYMCVWLCGIMAARWQYPERENELRHTQAMKRAAKAATKKAVKRAKQSKRKLASALKSTMKVFVLWVVLMITGGRMC